MGSMSCHITPLIINSLGENIYTRMHTDNCTKAIIRNQVNASLQPAYDWIKSKQYYVCALLPNGLLIFLKNSIKNYVASQLRSIANHAAIKFLHFNIYVKHKPATYICIHKEINHSYGYNLCKNGIHSLFYQRFIKVLITLGSLHTHLKTVLPRTVAIFLCYGLCYLTNNTSTSHFSLLLTVIFKYRDIYCMRFTT